MPSDRLAVALAWVIVIASGCDEPVRCGRFEWDPLLGRCVCPSGTIERSDGTCAPDDAAAPDAGRSPDAATDACASLVYRDGDGDGFGDGTTGMSSCAAPSGYVTRAGDCDDALATVSPDGSETCDGVDQDCDGVRDGDDLCPFGQGCIDATCTPIPIYEWSAHVRPRTGGGVRAVLVDGVPGTEEVVALIAFDFAADIGARAIGPYGQPSMVLVRFGVGGAIDGVVQIASGGITPRALAMDSTGAAYVVADLSGSATVLDRDLLTTGGRSLLLRADRAGLGWVQRFGELVLADVAARGDGFVACGRHTLPVDVAGMTYAGDSGGDVLVIRGDVDGTLTRATAIRGAASLACTGVSYYGDTTVAAGEYADGGVVAGAFNLVEPAGSDAWLAGIADDGTVRWASRGGGLTADVPGSVAQSAAGTFVPVASMYGATFGTSGPLDDTALALARRSGDGTLSAHFGSLSGDDSESPPISGLQQAIVGGPAVAVTLVRQFGASLLVFAPGAIAETRGASDIAALGYSGDGSSPAWFIHLDGPETEEAHAIAPAGRSAVAISGVFDARIDFGPSTSLTAASASTNGFVVVYRVR